MLDTIKINEVGERKQQNWKAKTINSKKDILHILTRYRKMDFTFQRPVGAAADAKELEYIAALHQTQDANDDDWVNGSIEATDVKNYLLSRYGIQVTKREVRDLIFRDMAGGDSLDECIDLTEGKFGFLLWKC